MRNSFTGERGASLGIAGVRADGADTRISGEAYSDFAAVRDAPGAVCPLGIIPGMSMPRDPIRIDAYGRASAARQAPSPNCDARPRDDDIRLVVVHGISLPPGEFGGDGIEQLFTNRLDPAEHPYYAQVADLRVSSHFVIRRDGTLLQFVPCAQRAWHAGVSCWNGMERCNDFSVGIELEGTDDTAYEDAQYATLAALINALRARYPIEDIVGHSDIAPGRKTDPGPAFEWTRLVRALEE
jgi:AmpD protein